MIIVLIT